MTAALHVVCGTAGSGTTECLLERYRIVARSTPGAALWIAPTLRSVEALRPRLLGNSAGLLCTHLYTFQDFAEELIRVNDPHARPLSDAQRRLLLADIVADLHAEAKLAHFERVIDTRGFAEGAFSFVADLKRNEIWPAAFARAALRRGFKGSRVTETRRGRTISHKDHQCFRLYATYQRQLIRHNLFDVEGRFWYARDLLARGLRRPFDAVTAVFLDGFSRFTRTQHEIIAALVDTVEEVWITLPDDPKDPRSELFHVPRVTLEKLPAEPRTENAPAPRPLPPGLAQIQSQLFLPRREVTPSADAEGIALIQAPGMLGEVRMVAREIKTRLLAGVPASDILVSLREVQAYADLLREVFTEYGIPHDVEGADPLLRCSPVATLLRALRLPDDGWPFAGVTALLRSNYFRPTWPELTEPALPQLAEALLRLLGEPRGRDAYLNAVDRWVTHPPLGLEDEEAEAPRRQRTHDLACRCADFLRRFFRTWDGAPHRAPLVEHVAWLRRFAAELGIDQMAGGAAWSQFWDELDAWVRLEARITGGRPRERAQVGRMLSTLAAAAGQPRSPRGPGRVRILSAELACNIEVPYLFVMGLGERSFPDLSAPEPLFNEAERQSFREAGLDLPGVEDRLPSEMLLFYQLVTRARTRLTLSYPAVDDKGQALLPSSFLSVLLDCSQPKSIPVINKNMLIEGYDREPPLCPAEYRVQVAARPLGAKALKGLSPDLLANLRSAALLADKRLGGSEFTAYDGRLTSPSVMADLQKRFGPEKVFSPTALETYVACPFRFFLESVLRLEPLEEPREEIEQTRRGAAFHRALSRLHIQLETVGVRGPSEDVTEHLLRQMDIAVNEYVDRAPSPASKVLWQIEGKRLHRSANRYLGHWQKFVEPWAEHHVAPRPRHFEASFGLPGESGPALVLNVDGVEVRIGGRIDRVDVADLGESVGFWIIDYKTGSGSHYNANDLRAFRRLQLTLYALAVEQVLYAEQQARPLGLAYWLVTDTGPKPVLPGSRKQTVSWLHDRKPWEAMRDQLRAWVTTLVSNIRQGNFPLRPRSDTCTETCDFAHVCRISQSRVVVEAKEWKLELPVVGGES